MEHGTLEQISARATSAAGSGHLPRSPRSLRGVGVWWLDVGEEAFAVLEVPPAPAPALTNLDVPSLTGAERQVAGLMLAGLTNEEIARWRGSAPRTIANQVASVFKKLNIQSRRELCVLAATGAKERP